MNFVGAPDPQVEVGKHVALKSGRVHEERRVAGGNVVEVISTAGISNRRLGGTSLFVADGDPSPGDGTAGRILYCALETAGAAGKRGWGGGRRGIHRGLMGLRGQ